MRPLILQRAAPYMSSFNRIRQRSATAVLAVAGMPVSGKVSHA